MEGHLTKAPTSTVQSWTCLPWCYSEWTVWKSQAPSSEDSRAKPSKEMRQERATTLHGENNLHKHAHTPLKAIGVAIQKIWSNKRRRGKDGHALTVHLHQAAWSGFPHPVGWSSESEILHNKQPVQQPERNELWPLYRIQETTAIEQAKKIWLAERTKACSHWWKRKEKSTLTAKVSDHCRAIFVQQNVVTVHRKQGQKVQKKEWTTQA